MSVSVNSKPTTLADNTLDRLLTEALRAKDAAKPPRDHSYFHDSAAGSCLRQRVLRRAGYEAAPLQADDLRNFGFGHMVHELIQSALLSKGAIPLENGKPLLERSVKSENGGGTYDCLVDLDGDGKLTLMDIKTCSVFAFAHLKKEGAKKNHQMQVCRYWLKLKDKYPIRDVRIYYLEKDKGWTREFGIPMSEKLIQETLDDIKLEQSAWSIYEKDQTLPPMISADSDRAWECKYCALAAHCEGKQAVSKYFQ